MPIDTSLWRDVSTDSNWKYVITDMSGAEYGEVQQAHNRTYSDPLDSMKTGGFTVAIDNPLAEPLLEEDTLMKVYKRPLAGGDWIHLMTGDVLSAEENGEGLDSYIDVVGVDPFWRIMGRLVGLDVDPVTQQGTGLTLGGLPPLDQDIGLMLMFEIGVMNEAFGNTCLTGVQTGSVEPSTKSMIGPVYATFLGQLIQDACNTLGGPDFEIVPIEPVGTPPNTALGTINFYTARGGIKTDLVFEYGTGQHNLQSYKRLKSKQNYANVMWGLPQGWPTAIARGDTPTVSINWDRLYATFQRDDIATQDVVSSALRKALCDEGAAVRGQFQQQITVQPIANCPIEYGVHYITGDVVEARATVNGNPRFDGSIRIYGNSIAIDDNDNEVVTMTLIRDNVSG